MNTKSTWKSRIKTTMAWFVASLLTFGSASAASVMFGAESGVLGSSWVVTNSPSPTNITILPNQTGNCPSNSTRVATYTITFPTNDTYQLYARVQVGPNAFNSDSLFFGNGFGTKNPLLNSDWTLVNGLASAGFSNTTDVVTGGGTLGTGMWKWINLSQFTSQNGFTVSAGNLTQTFQIGGRESGLNIDKFVFGSAGTAFTVSNLDTGTLPPPPPAVTPTPILSAPLRRPISPNQPMLLVNLTPGIFQTHRKSSI